MHFASKQQHNTSQLFSFLDQNARAARVLLLLAIPGHLIFLAIISKLQAGHTTLTPIFTVAYLLVGFLQVSSLGRSLDGPWTVIEYDWLVCCANFAMDDDEFSGGFGGKNSTFLRRKQIYEN